jgi:broad specificity phosphatase PhoE
VYASVLAASDAAAEAPAAPASLQQCFKVKKMSALPDATAGGGWSTAEAEEQRADRDNCVWLAQHGLKQSEAGECNWELRLEPAGVAQIEGQARRLAALPMQLQPSSIACSPFPRCVAAAAIFARALGLKELCVEPGLAEVMTPDLGGKGQLLAAPTWTAAELAREIPAGCVGVGFRADYSPVVRASELKLVGPGDRADVDRRAAALAEQVRCNAFDGYLLVTHGSPFKRMADVLVDGNAPGAGFTEPPMGAVLQLTQKKSIMQWMGGKMTPEWWLAPEQITLTAEMPEELRNAMGRQQALELFARAEYGWRKPRDGWPCPQTWARVEAHLFRLAEVPLMAAAEQPRRRPLKLPRPAALAVIHVESPEQAVANARRATMAGCSGVFLINHGNSTAAPEYNATKAKDCSPAAADPSMPDSDGHLQLVDLAAAFAAVQAAVPAGFFVGVNPIQLSSAAEQVDWAAQCGASGVWIDDMGIEPVELVRESVGNKQYVVGVKKQGWRTPAEQPAAAQALQAARARFDGLLFGGIAYKYLPKLHHHQDSADLSVQHACQVVLRHAAAFTAHFCDVLITSGPGTGEDCSVDKLLCLRGEWPLAFSGGSHRACLLAPHVDAVLSATAIGVDGPAGFLQLDEGKMRSWVDTWRLAGGAESAAPADDVAGRGAAGESRGAAADGGTPPRAELEEGRARFAVAPCPAACASGVDVLSAPPPTDDWFSHLFGFSERIDAPWDGGPPPLTDVRRFIALSEDEGKIHRVDPNFAS